MSAWSCPCGAEVSLREPSCPFCGRGYRRKYETSAEPAPFTAVPVDRKPEAEQLELGR